VELCRAYLLESGWRSEHRVGRFKTIFMWMN